MASLAPTFGRGAMTNTWQDIKNANVVVVMGGNAAEAHPCGFKWVIEAKIENQAKLVVVDPRFTRTASVADVYVPIRPGTDIAFLNGVIRYLLNKDAIQHDYVRAYTNAGLIVKDGFGFEDGLFTGYKEGTHTATTGRAGTTNSMSRGYAKIDDTWQHPRCVIKPAAPACRAVCARDGVAHLRQHRRTNSCRSATCSPPRRRARQGADVPVRPRLDAAFDRRAKHSHYGDGAASARQYSRCGRRDEWSRCAAIPTSRD